ncbi:hypothetical protein [Crocinitomix catalasitica]|uniref:hypothetical protein n=1 Tax=Crocinitomix catalasitica TaxID=184607 RepID=UPI000481A52A|nr:hypothetical protein [Crocinitomix catalasitica]
MKNLKTIIIIVLVAVLGYFAYSLTQNKAGASLAKEGLSEFAIPDTASIDKLILTDTEGNAGITLIRSSNGWESPDKECVQQHMVHLMLNTIKYIKVKSPVSEGSIQTVNKSLMIHHKKVEIYQNGKLAKTWFIGNPTQDQYGTFMLLSDGDKGRSPEPFIMYLPTMHGNLEPRFVTDPLEYECSGIFNYDPENIAEVKVEISSDTLEGFQINALADNVFELKSESGQKIEGFDTLKVRDYLINYRKVHFERHNYILDQKGVDSLLQVTPMQTITVKLKTGESKSVKLYRRKYDYDKLGLDGELLIWDQDRLWVVLEDNTLVAGQYHVFGNLMQNLNYFKLESY